MTAAFDRDKLRDELAKHMPDNHSWHMAYDGRESSYCKCGEMVYPNRAPERRLADVALAWVEAQMSEEWGQGRDARAVNRELREKTARWKAEGDPFGARAFRRLVTVWEPMEGAPE